MTRKVPEATDRRSPDRGDIPKRQGKGAILERGCFTTEQTEVMRAVDVYKKANNRPFPAITEILDVIKSLGYSRRYSSQTDVAARDLTSLRDALQESVHELRKVESEKGTQANEIAGLKKALQKQTQETIYAEEEKARLTRLLNRAMTTLDGCGDASEAMIKEIHREIASIKSGPYAMFGAENLETLQAKQAKLEADIAVLTGHVSTAVETLEKA